MTCDSRAAALRLSGTAKPFSSARSLRDESWLRSYLWWHKSGCALIFPRRGTFGGGPPHSICEEQRRPTPAQPARLASRCFLTATRDAGISVTEMGAPFRKAAPQRIEVHYLDGTANGKPAGNSPVSRRDMPGSQESQETANSWPYGDCFRGDRAAVHRAGRNPRQGRPAGPWEQLAD